jgi:hypothetical protein
MAYPPLLAKASKQYRPKAIRVLFIAEAPPALKSGRFFYFASLTTRDTLFLEMMKVLYPIDTGFVEYGENRKAAFDAKRVRQCKDKLLGKFMRDGFYLIDASEQPMPENANPTIKKSVIRNALPDLRKRVRKLCGSGDVAVVLLSSSTYSICAEAFRGDGLRVLNDEMIDHPARGGQKVFRRKLRAVMRKFAIRTSDGTHRIC